MSDQGNQYPPQDPAPPPGQPYQPPSYGGQPYPPATPPSHGGTTYGSPAPATYGQPSNPYAAPPSDPYAAPPSDPYAAPRSAPPSYQAYPQSAPPAYPGYPQSAPPAYPGQYSAPPQYGAPQYPTQPYGAPAGYQPPQNQSRTALWISIAVVLVLLVGAGTTAAILLTKDKGSSSATGGTGGTGGGGNNNGPVVEHLTLPPTIGSLTLAPSGAPAPPTSMSDDIRKEVTNPTGTVAGFYAEGDDISKAVVVVGVTGTVTDPDDKMTQIFNEPGSDDVQNVHDVNPGNLSGKGKCGSQTESGQTITVCVWVDPGSLGAVVMLDRSASDSEELFRQVRNAVLTRE